MLYTSYFALIPKLPKEMLKVRVSLFTPKWAQVDENMLCLNPTEQLLREVKSEAPPSEKAMKKYQEEVLKKLSPVEIYNKMINLLEKHSKKDLALLCYEKPGEICHRRFIAEWLEKENSVTVPEFFIPSNQISLIS